MCQQGWTEICTQGIIISFEDTSHDCHDYDDEILVKIVGGLSNSPIKCFLCANPPLSLITHVMTSYDTHCHRGVIRKSEFGDKHCFLEKSESDESHLGRIPNIVF